jgi:hypothetical protein
VGRSGRGVVRNSAYAPGMWPRRPPELPRLLMRFTFLLVFLLEFGFYSSSGLVTLAALQSNRIWGAGMASQVDYTNIWRCDDFQERVDKLCSTLAEKKGRLIVITDFDRCPLLLFCENRGDNPIFFDLAGRCPRIPAKMASPVTSVMISCFGIVLPTTAGRKKLKISGRKQPRLSKGKSPLKNHK